MEEGLGRPFLSSMNIFQKKDVEFESFNVEARWMEEGRGNLTF